MKRLAAILSAVAAVLALLSPPSAEAQHKVEKATLRLNWYAYGEHAPFVYGLKKGIYEAEGIDLTILEGNGSGPVVQAIGAGSDRFGYADAYAMAGLLAKGLPVKMISVPVQTSPLSIIYFADKPIKGPKDLEAKKVSFTAGDSIHQAFQALLKVNGVDKSKVQEVYFDPRGKMAAVMAGQVDAMGGYYTTQAGQLAAQTGKKVSYFRYADYGVNALATGLLVHTKYLADRDVNCRMVRATSRAWTEAAKNPEEAARLLVEMFPKAGALELNLSQWKDTILLMETPNSKGKPSGWMATADWDNLLTLQRTYGNIQTKEPGEYYTNEFFDCK
ncbi:MAG TPA: ABC transporter substrate-binding protein [Candidatus Sulfotelmatobacter sp.]|nr:ABC transporter substrate-binding protein [Candidatus Sulfotelmatobacter sp.]